MSAGAPSVTIDDDQPFVLFPEALLYDPAIDPLAKVVYGILRRHGMTPAECYPSHRRIADLVGVSERSVQRPIVTLERAGWVTRVRRVGDGDLEWSCSYIVRDVVQ